MNKSVENTLELLIRSVLFVIGSLLLVFNYALLFEPASMFMVKGISAIIIVIFSILAVYDYLRQRTKLFKFEIGVIGLAILVIVLKWWFH